jgi:hypothetical protein
MPDVLWGAPDAYVDYLTTGLNSLAAGTTVQGATITPGTTYTGRRLYATWTFIANTFSPVAGSSWDLLILEAADSTLTNFASPETAEVAHTFFTPAGTSVIRRMQRRLLVHPALPFQVALRANTGATTLASAGNILRYSVTTEVV